MGTTDLVLHGLLGDRSPRESRSWSAPSMGSGVAPKAIPEVEDRWRLCSGPSAVDSGNLSWQARRHVPCKGAPRQCAGAGTDHSARYCPRALTTPLTCKDPPRTAGYPRVSKQPTLVGTKLRPPPAREQSITRERLLDCLRSGSDRRLTLVACPAGFGKTTLLSAWYEAEAAQRLVAWLTLDEGDNDPVVLWSHAIGALRRANPDVAKLASAQSVVAPVIDRVLPRLVNELDGQGEITLILDDFHRVSSEPARASVRWFIEHAPLGFHVVLATRTEPNLPVARLRAHGELLELRAADLRFTCQEADAS